MALDGLDIAPLIDGFRRQRLLAEVALAAAMDQAAKRHLGIFRYHAQIAVQIAVGEDVTFLHQSHVILQDAGGANDIRLVAFDFERIVH